MLAQTGVLLFGPLRVAHWAHCRIEPVRTRPASGHLPTRPKAVRSVSRTPRLSARDGVYSSTLAHAVCVDARIPPSREALTCARASAGGASACDPYAGPTR